MFLAAVFAAMPATAQTPANVAIASGNGQFVCSTCRGGPVFFQPMYALVTDAGGHPISGYAVTWNVASGLGTLLTTTTTTDNTGTASNTLFPPAQTFLSTNAYSATVVTAIAGTVAGTFTETDGLTDIYGNQIVYVDFSASPTSLSGSAGTTGTAFIVRVSAFAGGGIPNVSVRLINNDGSSGPSPTIPSAYCATQAGADPYSVLTDTTGTATCTPTFGPVGGSIQGGMTVLVGGVSAGEWSIPGTTAGTLYNPGAVVYSPGTSPPVPGYRSSPIALNLTVTPAAVTSISATSGNGQSAVAGTALTSPLVATVNGATGPLSGQSVTWTATPAGAVTFTSQSTVTNSSGQVSATLTFTSAASGTVTIKVTSVTNGSASATFTETAVPPVTVSSLTKVAGDGQSTVAGTAFAGPLEVQLTTSSGSAVGLPISFSVSGPATLSSSAADTNSSGIAQVTVMAGSTPGNVTVTASFGTASVTFSLVVVPQGPTITASSFVNGADLQKGSISACGLATLAASGVAPAVAGTLVAPLVGPLPYQLGNATITFNSSDAAPLISVSSNAITFLVPCDLTAGTVAVTVSASGTTTTVSIPLLAASPGIFQTVQADGVTRAVIERPDGSFASPSNPARRGETVTAFVTGLGPVSPSVSTNALPIPGPSGYSTGTPSAVSGQVIVGVQSAGTQVLSSVLSPTQPGVFLITFQIPQGAPQANNVLFSVGVVPPNATTPYYSAGSQIPVQ